MHGTLVVMDVYGRSRCGSGVQLSCSTSIRGLRDRAQAFMGSRLRHGPWNIPSQIQLYELPGCLRRLVLDVVLALAPVKVTERDFRLCRTLLVSGFVLWYSSIERISACVIIIFMVYDVKRACFRVRYNMCLSDVYWRIELMEWLLLFPILQKVIGDNLRKEMAHMFAYVSYVEMLQVMNGGSSYGKIS